MTWTNWLPVGVTASTLAVVAAVGREMVVSLGLYFACRPSIALASGQVYLTQKVATRRAVILSLALEIVEIHAAVLERAAQPMPTELGTLDAIHLATALLWREADRTKLLMATHNRALALGAQAHGLAVVGTATVEDCIS